MKSVLLNLLVITEFMNLSLKSCIKGNKKTKIEMIVIVLQGSKLTSQKFPERDRVNPPLADVPVINTLINFLFMEL